MTERSVIVVGAGIGGLAAAVGLCRSGCSVTVLERAPELWSPGGGIGLTPNGLRALEVLGAKEAVCSVAIEQSYGGVRRPDGRWISRTDLEFIRDRFGDPILAVHRADLVGVLAGLVRDGAIRFGVRVDSVEPGDGRRCALVHTDDGTYSAGLVVAADGIGSAVRAALFPSHPNLRYAGYTSWRMVVPAAGAVMAGETWGRGRRFSLLPLRNGLVHCSALAVAPPRTTNDPADLVDLFGDWHDPIPQLLARVRPQEVLHHDITELRKRLPAFHRGRVVMVGDAAHAMTPNLGAASLALEDAATLAHAVGRARTSMIDPEPTLLEWYTSQRRPRSTAVARQARLIGAVGCWSSLPLVDLRAMGVAAAGLLPARLTARALDGFMGWRPAPAPASGDPPT